MLKLSVVTTPLKGEITKHVKLWTNLPCSDSQSWKQQRILFSCFLYSCNYPFLKPTEMTKQQLLNNFTFTLIHENGYGPLPQSDNKQSLYILELNEHHPPFPSARYFLHVSQVITMEPLFKGHPRDQGKCPLRCPPKSSLPHRRS